MTDTTCTHQDQIKDVTPSADGCEDCIKLGQHNWVELRMCLTCGHVGCCDNSPNRHARAHYKDTKHPIIESFKSGAGSEWRYCYIDDTYLDMPSA